VRRKHGDDERDTGSGQRTRRQKTTGGFPALWVLLPARSRGTCSMFFVRGLNVLFDVVPGSATRGWGCEDLVGDKPRPAPAIRS